MRKYTRLFSFITLMMFTLNIVIAQPLLATENGSEMPVEEAFGDSFNEEESDQSSDEPSDSEEMIGVGTEENLMRTEEEGKLSGFGKDPLPEVDIYTGSSRYSIPINLTAGRNGLSPSLNLAYNSYNRNGWVGSGWELEIGEITRSTKKLRGLDYSAFDFEMAGPMASGELVTRDAAGEWGPGFYGLKTEEQFSKFYNPNPSNTGWMVTTRDGKKYYYGTTNASRQFNTLGIFKWCLDKVEDSNGNTVDINYNTIEGHIYPSQILYTSINNGFFNKVDFILSQTDRPDTPISYATKSKVALTKRLESIEIYSNNSIVRKYQISYDQGPTSTRSRIVSVQETGFKENGVKTNFPATTFDYFEGGSLNYSASKATNIELKKSEYLAFIKIDDDNYVDLAVVSPKYEYSSGSGSHTSPYSIATYTSDGNGVFTKKGGLTYSKTVNSLTFSDNDNDGKSDIIITSRVDETITHPHHDEYKESTFSVNGHKIINKGRNISEKAHLRLRDYNGDGYLDTTFANYTYSPNGRIAYTTVSFYKYDIANKELKNEGQLTQREETPSAHPDEIATPYSYYIDGDYDGDGVKTDVKFFAAGSGFDFYITDINNDGLDDKVQKKVKKLSDGNGNFISYGATSHAIGNKTDINGDGSPDTLFKTVGKDNITIAAYISLNNGNFKKLNSVITIPKKHVAYFADINGNGLLDLLHYKAIKKLPYKSDLKIRYALSDGKADILKSVRNGHGGETHFKYKNSEKISNTHLPFDPYPVSSISIEDGNGGVKEYTYAYNGGFYDKIERDYRGFKKVTRTNPDNTTVETTFHQDKFLKGKKKSVAFKSNTTGNPEISRTNYTWEPIPETNTWGHIKLNKKETIFDGNTAHRTTDTYDRYNPESGQLEQMTVTGTRTDGTATAPIVHTYAYENLDTAGWMWRLKEETLTGRVDAVTPSGVVRKTSYTYYPTTNADGTFGDLQYEDYYSDTTSYIRTEYKYDSYGNVTSQIDPKGYVTSFVYDLDTHTYPETITNPKGHVIQKKWDYRFGVEKSVTDENGHTTTFTYDPFGRMIQTDSPDGGQATIEYEDTAIPNWVKTRTKENATDFTESIEYFDGFGRSVHAVSKAAPDENGSARFIVSKTHYDTMGRAWLVTGPFYLDNHYFHNWTPHTGYPHGMEYHYTQTDFDAEGRPKKIESPELDNGHIVTLFDYTGFDTTITDPDGNKKTEHKDHLGQIVQVTEHHKTDPIEDGVTRYEYNAAGDLVCVKNALWSETNDTTKTKTVITYDNLGRKKAMQDPDMGKWTYIYDANGNLKEQLDSKGQKSVFSYDEINRILTAVKHYPTGIHHAPEEVIYEYDNTTKSINGMGRLSQIKNGTSLIPPVDPKDVPLRQAKTVYNSYDVMGRPLKVSKTIRPHGERYTEYTYDLSGKTTEIAYPHAKNGKKFNVLYSFYPGTGLIKEVNSTLNGAAHKHFATLSNYTPVGKIGKVTFGNGVVTDYKYDGHSFRLHHILTQKDTATGTTVLMDKAYFYYHSGDIKSIDDKKNVISRTYTYDHLHRLETEESTVPEKFKPMELSYVYDDTNLTVPLHAPVNIKTLNKGVSKDHLYEYDENGNTIVSWDFRFPQNALKRHIKNWTPDNMPKKVEMWKKVQDKEEVPTEPEIRTPVYFKYDGEGKRVVKSERKKDIEKYDHMFYYFDHYEVQQRGNDSEGKRYVFAGNLRLARYLNGTNIAYFHKDHLGSTGATTDVDGKSTETTDYLPFGGNRSHTGPVHSDYKFTDQEKDAEIGLYNYDARLYDPMIGRFISPDSLVPNWYNPQTLDRYGYCSNNPLKYVDPNGDTAWDVVDVISFAHSAMTFAKNPTLANAAWLTADTIGLLPGVPGAGTVKATVKAGKKLLGGSKKAGTVVETGKNIEKVGDAANAVTKTGDAVNSSENTYEIVDGVRRAKANQLLRNKTINAEIIDSSGALIQKTDVPVDSLRSPNKSSIDMSNQTNVDRYMEVQNGIKSGDEMPPVTVTPGDKGVKVEEIEFDAIGEN